MEAPRTIPRLPGCTTDEWECPSLRQETCERVGFYCGVRKRVGPKGMLFILYELNFCSLRCQRKDSEKWLDMCVWSSQKKSGQDVRVCKAHMHQWY